MLRTKRDIKRLLARVRTDCVARHLNGRGSWTKDALTDAILEAHFKTSKACGVAFMQPGSDKTSVAVIDIDNHRDDLSLEDVLVRSGDIAHASARRGLKAEAFISRGGKGVHLWYVWENPQDAASVRQELANILAEMGLTAKTSAQGLAANCVEVFPKQNRLEEGRYGNFVWLPLNGKSTPLNLDFLIAEPEKELEWAFSKDVPKHVVEERTLQIAEFSEDTETADELLSRIPSGAPLGYDDWIAVGMALHHETGGSPEGLALWDKHSSRWAEYKGVEDLQPHWDSFNLTGERLRTIDTVYRVLEEHSFDISADEVEAILPDAINYGQLINPANYEGFEPPAREWVVPEWVPAGAVTGLYGDGGTGKSLLAMQLMTAVGAGVPFCGLETARCRALGVFCEDDGEELHRRQINICNSQCIRLSDLEDIRWAPRVGHDNLLMTFKDGKGVLTKFWRNIRKTAVDMGAKLIILDTAADLFGGNENNRQEVRQFVQGACGRLAVDTGAAVVLLAHPSRSGLASGGGESGSTAWNAAFRSRLYFTRDEASPNTDRRVLCKKKANYASTGDEIGLVYDQGCFVIDDGVTDEQRREKVKEKLVEITREVTAQGRAMSPKARAAGYAPKMAESHPLNREADYSLEDYRVAMEELLHTNQLEIGSVQGPDRHKVVSLKVVELG